MSGPGAAATLLLVLSLSLVASPPAARAQGETLERRRTEHFTFVYRRRFEPLIRNTIETAEASRRRILEQLGEHEAEHPAAEVRFARNVEEMRRLCPRPPPSWADAVAFSPDQIIVISLTTPRHRPVSVETVFRHELSHLALRWVVGDRPVPRWFNEGLAVTLSGELPMERLRFLWPAAARNELTRLRRLDRRFPAREFEVSQAYAESADAVRFLTRHRGPWRFRELLERLRRGEPFYNALEASWDQSVVSLERDWHRDVRRRYSAVPAVTAGMTLWLAVGLGAVAAYIKRRREIRRRIDAMEDVDEEDDDEPAPAPLES